MMDERKYTFERLMETYRDVLQWEDAEADGAQWDLLLMDRSAMEHQRERLDSGQRTALAAVDAYWLEHAEEANQALRYQHNTEARRLAEETQGYAIPRAHWWWWPIEVRHG